MFCSAVLLGAASLGATILASAGCSGSSSSAADAGAALDADAASDAGPADGGRDTAAPPDTTVDSFVPLSIAVTIDELPAALNGSQPYTDDSGRSATFRVSVPTSGFTVDVSYAGSDADAATLSIKADVALGDRKAGDELADLFARPRRGAARLLVPTARALPAGAVTFTASIDDKSGAKRSASLGFDVAKRAPTTDPFRLEDRWLLVFTQDLYTITGGKSAAGDWTIASSAKPNGVADFVEDLAAAGLISAKETADAAKAQRFGKTGARAIVAEWVKREIVAGLRAAYGIAADGTHDADSVGIRFIREDAAGAPKLADYTYQKLDGSETTRGFSAISIGGGDLAAPFLGRSKTVDRNNLQTEDNIGPGHGVFTTKALSTMAKLVAADPTSKSLVTLLLGDFVPELGAGGTPVGSHALDGVILDASYDEKTAPPKAIARARKIATVIETLGRLVGALTAHEVGHALGLVVSGAPPYGLFGGAKKAEFTGPRTTGGHIDTAGFNIMEAGPSSAPGVSLNIGQLLGEGRFNPLNMAYLRGRLLVLTRP